MLDGSKPFPFKLIRKNEGKYKMITWNATMVDLMASWQEVKKDDWDCIILQETQQWSDDCLKWVEGVTAHSNIMAKNRKDSVRLCGKAEAKGNIGVEFGMMTIFKKGQIPKLEHRHPNVIVSSVRNGSGDILIIINIYLPVWTHMEDGKPIDEKTFKTLPEQRQTRLQEIFSIVQGALKEAHELKRAVIIAGDFNQPFHKQQFDGTEPSTRTWTINKMFDTTFLYKVTTELDTDGKKPYTYWRGREEDTDGKGTAEIDAYFVNEWAMAGVDGYAQVLEYAAERRRDHRPIQLSFDMKVMTQVREQYRNWRTEPLPKRWRDDDWDSDVKEDIIQKVIKAIDSSDSARALWAALNETYKDFPRQSKGKTGTRLPGEFAEARLMKQQLEQAFQAKDKARIRQLKAELEDNNRRWQQQRQDEVRKAAKNDQRYLVDAMKGNFRTQSKIYALQDDDGKLQTSKAG
eukprot:gene9420-12215_t